MMSRSRGSRRMYRGGWTWQHQARGTATNMEQPTWGTRCSRLDADMLGSRANLIGTQLGALALSACLPALWNSRGRRRRASYTRWSTSGETIRRCQGADAQAGRAGKSIGVAAGLVREAHPRLRSVKGRRRR
jgi:hypothetical protein